ncbi:9412_t:CDS:2 [Ambispora leptoticha]|uniref:RBR-type E3 ubiquitin transferase n=1 Tax=Ambispora leptoticha TaxID=144679 RepID=A0A9N9HQ03_9GLOM|nr:9412_t:CDS:2 [Ambispora leptoticha]
MFSQTTKECKICNDDVPVINFTNSTTKCNHKDICRACLNKNIDRQLNLKGNTNIECLERNCKVLMEYEDMKRVVSKDLFERYDHLCFRQAIRQMPDFRWCKSPDCGSGQEHFERDKAPIMICAACGKMTCYTHDVPWHKDLTCAQYDIVIQTTEGATQDAIERETKPCPKCQIRIFKLEGCSHMTCANSGCYHQFCWLCGADYKEILKHGNNSHKTTCELYGKAKHS